MGRSWVSADGDARYIYMLALSCGAVTVGSDAQNSPTFPTAHGFDVLGGFCLLVWRPYMVNFGLLCCCGGEILCALSNRYLFFKKMLLQIDMSSRVGIGDCIRRLP